MERRTRLAPMSARRLAELAEAGNPRPFSTLTNRSRLNRSAVLDRKPATPARPTYTGPDAATVALVVERDQGRCVRCGDGLRGVRGRDWSVQHRRARQGRDLRPDTNLPPNLILLCGDGTTLCHGWVEHNRNAARVQGWAIRQTDVPLLMPVVHAVHGRVWLADNGSFSATRNDKP